MSSLTARVRRQARSSRRHSRPPPLEFPKLGRGVGGLRAEAAKHRHSPTPVSARKTVQTTKSRAGVLGVLAERHLMPTELKRPPKGDGPRRDPRVPDPMCVNGRVVSRVALEAPNFLATSDQEVGVIDSAYVVDASEDLAAPAL